MSDDIQKIFLKNVRCSFPALWKKPIIKGKEGKFGIKLLLDPKKNTKEIVKIKAAMQKVADESSILKGRLNLLPADKLALREPNLLKYPEYEGYQTLSCGSSKRVPVVDSSGKDLVTSEDECKIYSGCYVNASVSFWFQNNEWGQRINSSIISVQFAGHGEPFGSGVISKEMAVEGFEPIEEDDEDVF